MYFLGVDGGGSKTAFYLTDEKGVLKASSFGKPTNYIVDGINQTVKVFENGVNDVCSQVKISVDDITSCFIAVAGFGDIKADEENIKASLQNVFPKLKLKVGNDTENALVGSLAGEIGINIIAGTGSIGLGINANGELLRCGGWHHLFGGDEGSAYWIACKALLGFTRQSDNRDEKTYLYHYLKETYNWKDDSQMLDTMVNKWNENRSEIAKLAKDVSYCASNNDKYCIQILDESAKQLSDIIIAIYDGLGFDDYVSCSYSGGVFNCGDLILEPLKKHLSLKKINLKAPVLSPGAGAVLIAMKDIVKDYPIDQLKKI